MVRSVILVGIGGGIGSICRYLISWVLTKYFSASFPWGTFISNFLGCLIIGIFMGVLLKSSSYQHEIQLLFVTGFCGGFTTFSAFASENLQFIQSGQILLTLIYIFSSIVIGLLSVWAGILLVR